MLWYNHSFVLICLLIGIISQVSDVAHGHLVLLNVVSFFTGECIQKEIPISFQGINILCIHKSELYAQSQDARK